MKQKIFIFIITFCLLGISAFPVSNVAFAAATQTQFTKPLPGVESLSEEEFKSETRLIQEKPFTQNSFEYSFRLPKNWKNQEAFFEGGGASTDMSYGTLAKYSGTAQFGETPYIEIQMFQLKDAIGAFHWFYNKILQSGFSLEAIEPLGWDQAQALYVTFERGRSYKVRSKVFLYGPRIVQVSYYQPVNRWEEKKDFQARVINSFSVNESEQDAEDKKTYEIFNISKFDFYTDWELRANSMRDVQSVSINFTHKSDKKKTLKERFQRIDGFIKLSLFEKDLDPDLTDEIQTITREVEKSGYDVGMLIETITSFKPSENVEAVGIERYELLDQTGDRIDHELWVAILKSPDYYFLITLDSPSRDGKYLEWAHNIAAFKTLVESISPI